MMDHVFVPSMAANPRLARSCGKCSRVPEAHPEPPRRPEFEHQFLEDMVELVGQIRGMSHNPSEAALFVQKVRARLDLGEVRYGATEFLDRDNLVEVDEEAPDIPAYGMLELQRHLWEGASEDDLAEMRVNLVCAAAHAAIADQYARAARVSRTEAGL